jgi:hypothetical protein
MPNCQAGTQSRSEVNSSALRLVSLAMLYCLLTLLTACSSLTSKLLIKPDPPLPELVQLCDEGADALTGAATIAELTHVVRLREKAFAECRARHSKLVQWADLVSKPK